MWAASSRIPARSRAARRSKSSLVYVVLLAVAALGTSREPAEFGSDWSVVRMRGFWLASAGILMIALGYGALDGPLPLHFGERLDQSEIAGLYVVGALVLGASAAAAGRGPPRPMLAAAAIVI